MESPPPMPLPKQSGLAKAPLAFGVLNIVFAGFGLIGSCVSAAIYFGPVERQTGPVAELIRGNAFFYSWMRILIAAGAVFMVAQLISGIGLLKSREWARKLAIFCALYSIAAGIFMGYLSVQYLMPATIEQALQSNPQGMDPQVTQMIRTGAKIGGIVGAFSGLIFPILTIIFMMLPKVRVQCIAASSKPKNLIA